MNIHMYMFDVIHIVIYDRKIGVPIVAIELDGKYHKNNQKVIENDEKKNKICSIYEFPIIRISSTEYKRGINMWELIKKYLV